MGFWDSLTEIPNAIAGGVIDFAGDMLGNQFINKPNSAHAAQRAERAATLQYEREKEAATTAWKRQSKYHKAFMDKQYQRQKNLYRNRYKWTMQDMKGAGLNPILAASGGFNVGSAGVPSASVPAAAKANSAQAQVFQAQSTDYATGTQSARQLAESGLVEAQNEKVVAEIDEVIADTSKKRNEAIQALAKAEELRQEAKNKKWEERNIMARLRNIEQDYWVKVSQYSRNMKEAYVAAAKYDMTQQETQLIMQQTKNLEIERRRIYELTKKIQAELAKLSRTADVYRSPIGKVLAYMKEINSALNISGVGVIGPTKLLRGGR